MYGTDCRKVLCSASFSVRAMQQADVRIGALDHLAVQLQHQAQHAVRRRVLRPKVHGVILISAIAHTGHDTMSEPDDHRASR